MCILAGDMKPVLPNRHATFTPATSRGTCNGSSCKTSGSSLAHIAHHGWLMRSKTQVTKVLKRLLLFLRFAN
jgi:hypothetical protein